MSLDVYIRFLYLGAVKLVAIYQDLAHDIFCFMSIHF